MESARPAEGCRLCQFRVTLRGVSPPIWRRVQVREDYTLDQLHRVLQVAMGWENYHLYEFRIGGTMYRDPHPENETEILNAKRARICNVLSDVGARLEYVYDFGDYWQHDVVMEKVLLCSPNTLYPCCVFGERNCPPEDVGGTGGYEDYLEAMADPSHARHEELMAWRGPFDPEAFSVVLVNKQLEKRFRPARKRTVGDWRAPRASQSPRTEQHLEEILPRLDFPRMKRIRIKPDEKIPLELKERERVLILEHTLAKDELTNHLRVVPKKGQRSIFRFTLDDLEELGGFVAAEANHTGDKKLRKELDRLFDRMQNTLESYTDEPFIN
ncbi:MAG TPA: plasmid pRiA4b ORF-3 family protein [Candidatus Acidoferrum sp.]|nr:plasmid pRiA4b ORF-3 family protein [Candidatus Acidoferrum sp.]